MADIDSSHDTPLERGPHCADSVCMLVDGLARMKREQPGQPIGLLFELFCGEDRPPVNVGDGVEG